MMMHKLALAALLLSTVTANATPIVGRISIFSSVDLDVADRTIEFESNSGFVLPVIASGDFARPWTQLAWSHPNVEIPWLALNGDLFSISGPGALASFEFTSYALSTLPFTPFVAIGEGCMHMTGFETTCGKASMTSQLGFFPNEYGNWTGFTFEAMRSVPAPTAGAGWVGFGMFWSVLSLNLLQRYRRRRRCA